MNPLQRLLLTLSGYVPPTKLVPVTIPAKEITLDKWRKDESMVVASMALAKHHTYVAQLGVLECEHPRYLALKLDASVQERAALQARSEGYQMCLNNLQAMSTPLKVNRPVTSTFEPETK